MSLAIEPRSHPTLTLVAAMTPTGVIGDHGTLPWELPEDLRLFRELTWGGTLIMGGKTMRSLPSPLPGRFNLVVSRQLKTATGRTLCTSWPAALTFALQLSRPIYVIGGASIYQQALHDCQNMVISRLEQEFEGNILFPDIDWSEWRMEREEAYCGFRRCFYRRQKL